MKVTTLMMELERRAIRLEPNGEDLRCRAPKGALTPYLKEAISARKSEILALLRNRGAGGSPSSSLARPGGQALHRLFELRAEASPEAVAISAKDGVVTYAELDRRSRHLAKRLRSLGAGPEVVIGLRSESVPKALVGALGILRAGAVCFPLRPGSLGTTEWPADIRVVLTEMRFKAEWKGASERALFIDDELSPEDAPEGERSDDVANPANLALVAETAGTCAEPKRVALSHGALTDALCSLALEMELTADDTLLSAPQAFSSPVWPIELFLPLTTGGCLKVAGSGGGDHPNGLAGDFEGVTVVMNTPSRWRLVIAGGWRGQTDLRLVSTGEPLDGVLANELKQRGRALWNVYGCVETGIIAALHQVAETEGTVPVGRPLAASRLYVLNDDQQPVAGTVPAELYVGGDTLARGYLDDPVSTAERFLPDPFGHGHGSRLFRTGDRARWLSDGALEMLGRFEETARFDTLRVETLLRRHPKVVDVAAVVHRDPDGRPRLVAHVVTERADAPSVSSLKQFVAGTLPSYQESLRFSWADSLPLTSMGKLDRRALKQSSREEQVLRVPVIVPRLPGEELDELLPRTNLSKNQLLVWAGQNLQPDVPFYNLGALVTLDGSVEQAHLERAFQAVLDASDALRTVIEEANGVPRQRVLPPFPYRMETLDFSAEPDADAALEAWARQRCETTFDLGRRLFEAAFVKMPGRKCAWFLRQHHIISDAWSFALILRQVEALYRRSLAGEVRPSLELPAYSDFVEFERERLDTDAYRLAKEYWQQKLHDDPAPLEFYGRESRRRSNRVQRVSCELGDERSKKVVEIAAAETFSGSSANLSRFAVFGTALLAYLYRVSGNRMLSLGTTLLNRPSRKFKETIGMFVQMACLRLQISDGETFESLSRKLLTEMRDTMRHRRYATGNSPQRQLFDVLINYETVDFQSFNGAAAPAKSVYKGYGDESLALLVRDYASSGCFSLDFDFRCDVFGEAQRALTTEHFLNVVDTLLDDSGRLLDSVDLLSPRERQTILAEFNATDAPIPGGQTLLPVLQQQVERVPDKIACVYGTQSLTYRQLDFEADRIAGYLRSVGVGPDVVVVVLTRRSIDFLVAVLAVFKAGGAYLPLDPVEPSNRFSQVLGQSGAQWLLCSGELLPRIVSEVDRMPPAERPEVSCIEELRQRERSRGPLSIRCGPRNLSYVIYTSGSTGVPKGAMVEHVGMLNHLIAKIGDLGLTDADRVAQTASQCFDISVWQFLAVLMVGGRLEIATDEAAHDPSLLSEWIDREGITIFETVPTMLRAMLEQVTSTGTRHPSLSSLTWMVVTGEALPTELCRLWLKLHPGIPMLNAYGPTECSDDVTHGVIDQPPARDVVQTPIGRPVANMRLFVLDRSGLPLPVGAIGGLFVAGVGVGRGYLRDPMRTAEVFVPDPFSSEPGSRLYRTGDLGRYRPDGNLEFLGRTDHQVKVRGFRIELGEIESLLEEHVAVRAAVALAREEGTGGKRLVAYVVPSAGVTPSSSDLRAHLERRLPDYMVPAAFVFLEAFPLMLSGKVDRRALPAPDRNQFALDAAYVAPSTPTERKLAEIWAEVLEVERVGVHDGFFELGGHSLSAIQLISRVRETFGIAVTPPNLFSNPTVGGLAAAIDSLQAEDGRLEREGLDLQAEVVLDSAITVAGLPRERFDAPSRVLLTGGTGFLGAFLLHEILEQTEAEVYCLVRCESAEEGWSRLRNNLDRFGLGDETIRGRVTPLPGDLAKPLLGLSVDRFEALASEIDSIYHCGAWVSGFYPYAALKSANVLGTEEVLRLASRSRVKPVHHVSTISVFSGSGYPEGKAINEDDELESGDRLQVGYSQSKWVAEKLVEIARMRGLPVAVYRPGQVTGESHTGVCNTDDAWCRSLKTLIEFGAVPDLKESWELDMTPVDYVAQALVHLSLQEASLGRTFHLVNPNPIEWHDFVEYARAFGYHLPSMPLPEWGERLRRFTTDQDTAMTPLLPAHADASGTRSEEMLAGFGQMRFDCRNTLAGLEGSPFDCPRLTPELIETYFSYFVRSGFLAPPESRYQGAASAVSLKGD